MTFATQSQQGQASSSLKHWAFAALAAWGAQQIWEVGQAGEGVACLGAALLSLLAVRSWWSGMVAHDQRQLLKRVQRKSKEESTVHGSATWAKRDQLRAADLEKPSSIFLAEFEGRELFYPGENSVTILAPPGAGKTTCFAVQHLLRTAGSCICLDPKLELFSTCASSLERRGFRVLVVSPWFESFAAQFGGRVETRDDGFDPCSFLDPTAASVIDDCRLLASLLIPDSGRKQGSDDTHDFFQDFSRSILVAFMLLALSEQGRVTLPGLRRRIMAPEEELENDIASMLTSEAFSGVLAEEGARLYSPKVNAPKEWSGGLSGAMRALKLFDAHGPLGRSVEKSGVDLRTFKDQKTCLFIAQPTDKVDSHKGYVGMVLILAMEMLARDRRKIGVTFLLDELQNTPSALLPILKGIALYRGTGLQFICLFQFLAALKRHVGESWREFLSVDVVAAFGAPSDPETLDILSRLTGQTTVRSTNYSSDAERIASGGLGVGIGSQEVARPLLTPSEVRTMNQDDMLLFIAGLPAIRAKKQSYLNNRKLRRLASPNPYYV